MTPNIDQRGRQVRAAAGICCLIAGAGVLIVVRSGPTWMIVAGGLLIGAGAFMVFEAVRGWCLLRACGIRTRV